MNTQRILVVDDEPLNREVLSQELEDHYEVIQAESGPEALTVIESSLPDLVLLDIQMPQMDGYEVLDRIRKQYAATELPVIMATARTGSDDIVRALEAGANDYVTKPIDIPVLLARIVRLLHGRSKRDHSASALRKLAVPTVDADRTDFHCPRCGTAIASEATACRECGNTMAPGGWPRIPRDRYRFLGEVIIGRYLLDRWLGGGASGAVYRARDRDLGRFFAAKIIDTRDTRAALNEELAREDLRTEVLTMAKLRSPHVVAVYELLHIKGTVFAIIMEWVEGVPLTKLMKRLGALPPDEAVGVARQVALGLHDLHRSGMVHHDLQPGNVVVTPMPGGGYFAKLLDFGVVRESGGQDVLFRGSPRYASPEQLTGQRVDDRADVYGLGCLLYYMLSGDRPYTGRSKEDLVTAQIEEPLPQLKLSGKASYLTAVVREMTAKDPSRRPRSATAVITLLDGGLAPLRPLDIEEDPGNEPTVMVRRAPKPPQTPEPPPAQPPVGVAPAPAATSPLTGAASIALLVIGGAVLLLALIVVGMAVLAD